MRYFHSFSDDRDFELETTASGMVVFIELAKKGGFEFVLEKATETEMHFVVYELGEKRG